MSLPNPAGIPDFLSVSGPAVYEISQNSEVIKISTVLERVFRLTLLKESEEMGVKLEEEIPVCAACANILTQIDLLYQDLERVRRLDSYLSLKLAKIDEVIRETLQGVQVECNPDSVVSSDVGEVKVESMETEEEEETDDMMLLGGSYKKIQKLKSDRSSESEGKGKESCSEDTLGTEEDTDLQSDLTEDVTLANSDGGDGRSVKRQRLPRKRYYLSSESESDFSARIPQRSSKKKRKQTLEAREMREENARRKARLAIPGTEQGPKKYGRTEWIQRRKQLHPYPCIYCHLDFDVESDRVAHMQETHCTSSKSVICSACGKLFANEYLKKYHEPRCDVPPKRFHLPPFICKDCGKEFELMDCLRAHIRHVHSDERPYPCNLCDFKAKATSSLSNHMKLVHSNSSEVQCPQCQRTVKNKNALKGHIKRMHTAEGAAKYQVQLHKSYERLKQITRDKQAKQTTFCQDCNIDFFTVLRWIKHRHQVHDDISKWQCEQCGKRLTSKKSLISHQRFVHTDERPYTCDQCGAGFKNPTHLRNHIDRLHTEGGKEKWIVAVTKPCLRVRLSRSRVNPMKECLIVQNLINYADADFQRHKTSLEGLSVMETELTTLTDDGTSPEVAVGCSNCCEQLIPVTQTDPADWDGIQDLWSRPVYELTQGDQVQGIRPVLERIYRFGQLKDLSESEDEDLPLCPNCASILNQMDNLHQEFDRLRSFQSYLSGKIQQMDIIIANRIADLRLQLIGNEQSKNNHDSSLPGDSQVEVKIESEEPSNIKLGGPWVVIKRLRPEEIPGDRQEELEETSRLFHQRTLTGIIFQMGMLNPFLRKKIPKLMYFLKTTPAALSIDGCPTGL
ncbi:unnamed protein product [Allacma fusca]|uniref:C2H2-type domain-containing protein n=1 Tax=Allacma fusca TaxID=39272 RepID=A0A8J2KZ32_9HEXA|nr:unnamed protein product [Allacma fusca]